MKLSKLIYKIMVTIALILLSLVLILNIFHTAYLTTEGQESIIIRNTGIHILLIAILISFGIYFGSKSLMKINIQSKKTKTAIIVAGSVIYTVLQIIWINYLDIAPIADQERVLKLGAQMFNGTDLENIEKIYFQMCPHQLPLAFMWNIIFAITRTTDYHVLQYCNAIANTISLILILNITKEFSKKYKVNKFLTIIIFMLFICVPALSTFIYGDEIGLAFALGAVLCIIKFRNTQKYKYFLTSAFCAMFAFAFRTNYLIFIIAIAIYLTLDIIKNIGIKSKEFWIKALLLLTFILISIAPCTILKESLIIKYKINKDNQFSSLGYIVMGITDTSKGSGWYNSEVARLSLEHNDKANSIYKKILEDRLESFSEKPLSMIEFYGKKITSMWAENTYASVCNNLRINNDKNATKDDYIKGHKLIEKENYIIVLQKAVIIVIFACTVIVTFQNRKEDDLDLLLLLLIFMGGFAFHIIWEAKSRYIIPYIVILLPISAIMIKSWKIKK